MDTRDLTLFAGGLLLGLLAAGWVALTAWRRRRELVAELGRLRKHLDDHMEITHEGSAQRKRELERLREENEKLRVTVKAWQQKPDRRELRMLLVYDRAVRQIAETAPGFSPYWENALREAEQQVDQMDRGLLAFARRILLPGPRRPVAEGKPSDNEE
jgi:hypothetical protein